MANNSVSATSAPSSALKWGLAAGAVMAAAGVMNYALARRAERKDPPEGRFCTIDGVRLHYIERGSGPVIVLLHGNGTMARDFVQSGVFDLLCADHRVIAFDRPGFGFSDRPRNRIWTPDAQAALLVKALRRLNVSRAVIVGHSWGTLVAMAIALQEPELTAGLGLLAGYYYPSVRLDAVLMSGPAVPVLGDILRYTVSPLAGRLMAPAGHRKMFAPAPVPARFTGGFPTEMEVRPSQIRAASAEAVLMVPGAASLVDRHNQLSMPVAIMAGTDDKIVDCESQAGRLGAELQGSRLYRIPATGHMIHYTHVERVADVIGNLARVPLGSEAAKEPSTPEEEVIDSPS